MSKRELIDRIRVFNPTAASTFLAQFGEGDLDLYLKQLQDTTPPSRLTALRESVQQAFVTEDYHDPRQLALTF